MAYNILNPTIRALPISPTFAMTKRAALLAQKGHPVISLSVGEPDIPIPPWVQEAAIQAIREGNNRYSMALGLPKLREAIVAKLAQENGLDWFTPENILIGCGAKQVLFSAFLASLRQRDEVIIPAPYWGSYTGIVEVAGAYSVVVPAREQDNFKISPKALERAITPYTRWFLLNSPNNPTGAVYSPTELEALADVLERHPHVWVLSDEVYEYFTYGDPFTSIGAIAPFLKDRLLIVNGVSKAFSMMGWRIGYGAGPASLIQGLEKLNTQSVSHPCLIAQQAAVAALTRDHRPHTQKALQLFRERRDSFVAALNTIPGLLVRPPEGAFYVYVNCQGLLGRTTKAGAVLEEDSDVSNALLDEYFLSTVPGTDFGTPGYLRLSYAVAFEKLQEAVKRIQAFVSDLA